MFSIVIPTYNRAIVLQESLDSIFKQTFKTFEVIVVDDGSNDNTQEIVENFKNKYNITYIKQTNQGAQRARNVGVKNAKYDWICFQDSDDTWVPEKLSIQVDYLKQHNFSKDIVLYSNCYIYKESENKTFIHKIKTFNGRDCFKQLLLNQGPMFQSMVVSKSLLKKIDYLDEDAISWQEWDTSIQLSRHANFIHIEAPLFIYNLHQGETISKNMLTYIKGYMYILNKYKNDIIKLYSKEEYLQQVLKMKKRAISENLIDQLKELF